MLILGAAAVFIFTAYFFLGSRVLLLIAVPISIFQFYLPSSVTFVPPLVLVAGLSLWPNLLKRLKLVLLWPPTAMISGIILCYTVSLLWSPTPESGFRAILYYLLFLIIFATVQIQAVRDERFIKKLLKITVIFGLFQAFLVVIFRIDPDLKAMFLSSDLAKTLLNPVEMANFLSEQNLVDFDPTKSGGLFLNGNVGGEYLGFLSAISFGLSMHDKSKFGYLVSALLLIACIITGSKTGLFLSLSLAFALFLVLPMPKRIPKLPILIIGTPILAALFLTAYFKNWFLIGGQSGASINALSAAALQSRFEIWNYGWQAFKASPVFGQGFGGWENGIAIYAANIGLPAAFPPHNTFIYLWSQGTIFAVFLSLVFIYSIERFGLKLLGQHNSGLGFAVAAGFGWVFIHGMADNSGLIGEEHMIPILATLLAYVLIKSMEKLDVP